MAKKKVAPINTLPNHLRDEVKKLEDTVERWRSYANDGTATDKQLDTFWTLIADVLIRER